MGTNDRPAAGWGAFRGLHLVLGLFLGGAALLFVAARLADQDPPEMSAEEVAELVATLKAMSADQAAASVDTPVWDITKAEAWIDEYWDRDVPYLDACLVVQYLAGFSLHDATAACDEYSDPAYDWDVVNLGEHVLAVVDSLSYQPSPAPEQVSPMRAREDECWAARYGTTAEEEFEDYLLCVAPELFVDTGPCVDTLYTECGPCVEMWYDPCDDEIAPEMRTGTYRPGVGPVTYTGPGIYPDVTPEQVCLLVAAHNLAHSHPGFGLSACDEFTDPEYDNILINLTLTSDVATMTVPALTPEQLEQNCLDQNKKTTDTSDDAVWVSWASGRCWWLPRCGYVEQSWGYERQCKSLSDPDLTFTSRFVHDPPDPGLLRNRARVQGRLRMRGRLGLRPMTVGVDADLGFWFAETLHITKAHRHSAD